MNVPLKMLFIIVGVVLTTLGMQSLAANFTPTNVFFFGFLWGSVTTTVINMILTFTENK